MGCRHFSKPDSVLIIVNSTLILHAPPTREDVGLIMKFEERFDWQLFFIICCFIAISSRRLVQRPAKYAVQ